MKALSLKTIFVELVASCSLGWNSETQAALLDARVYHVVGSRWDDHAQASLAASKKPAETAEFLVKRHVNVATTIFGDKTVDIPEIRDGGGECKHLGGKRFKGEVGFSRDGISIFNAAIRHALAKYRTDEDIHGRLLKHLVDQNVSLIHESLAQSLTQDIASEIRAQVMPAMCSSARYLFLTNGDGFLVLPKAMWNQALETKRVTWGKVKCSLQYSFFADLLGIEKSTKLEKHQDLEEPKS